MTRFTQRSRGCSRVRTQYRFVLSIGLIGLVLALLPTTSLWGDEPASPDSSVRADDNANATVTMKANRIRHWDFGGDRWVLLEGDASVFTGIDGPVLAPSALARVSLEGQDGQSARIDLYSMDLAAAEDPLKHDPILQLNTRQRLMLRARTPDGVVALQEPPLGFRTLADGTPRSKATENSETPGQATAGKPQSTQMVARNVSAAPQAQAANGSKPAVSANRVSEPSSDLALLDQAVNEARNELGDASNDATRPQTVAANAPVDSPAAPVDPRVSRTQMPGFDPNAFPGGGSGGSMMQEDPAPNDPIDAGGMPGALNDLEPLDREDFAEPPSDVELPGSINPDSQRSWSISPRYGARQIQLDTRTTADGRTAYIIRGGVIIVSEVPGRGRVDLSADHAVLWTRKAAGGEDLEAPNPGGGAISQDASQELEVYLEGDVIIRNDRMKFAGSADQSMFKANSAYYDFRTERLVALDAEINLFAPGLMSPIRTTSPLINQYREQMVGPDGGMILGTPRITAEQSSTTGSRFPQPGYRFNSRSVDITQIEEPLRDPYSGGEVAAPRSPLAPKESNWLVDSRSNTYYMGPVPVFWWPRIKATDDFDPPIRNLSFRYGNYFGYQVMTDWNAFKLLGMRKPSNIDTWNIDIDYLSLRGPALGSEVGWFGRDIVGDMLDPFGKRGRVDYADQPYFGYSDAWGIMDKHNDVLGPGPAVVTNGPPGAGKAGYQRTDVPSYQTYSGRTLFRHMQSLLGPNAEPDDDFRVQAEMGSYTDRNFLEQYYKRLFDSGLDQNTLIYGTYQHRNQALTLTGQVNTMDWITDTQWLPKLEYYRIGDSLLDNTFSYSSNYGVDYANVHTATEVNNPNLFAFIPYDPISNTSGPWSSGRAWTTQQMEMPINLDVIRIIPYGQGQFMGWSNQLNNQPTGRAWGAFGVRANMMAWKLFPTVESELFNVHGLAHKINLDVDLRSAYSNVSLNSLGIQDNLDDDTYEWVRRYFALTNYTGGVLPAQYDPRFLLLRRSLNPVVFAPDVQGTISTLNMALHQRLQTKRGPEGRRRIVDYMILDLQSTFYPNRNRDNFGQAFGQTMYNYEWYLGDRTSFVSTGWFEFWDIKGNPILVTDPRHTNDPFGLSVVTAGLSINRPPRGNVYLGYSIVNTGPISTSALNSAFNYWLSPKWYGSFAMSYDFGNGILLGTTFSLTKITADYLTSVGLSVDPQRQNYTFGFEVAPRFSPTAKLGSAVGTRFDSRFAPTQ